MPIIVDLPAIAQTRTPTVPTTSPKPTDEPDPNVAKPTSGTPERKDSKPALTNPGKPPLENSNFSIWSILSWLAIILHLLEIGGLACLVMAMVKLQKSDKKKTQQLLNISENLTSFEGELITKNNSRQSNNSDSVAQLIFRLNEMDRQITSLQQNRSGSSSQQQTYSSQQHRALPPAPPAMRSSGYPFLDLYKQNPDACKSRYSAIRVSENEENFQKRWGGQQQDVILEISRKGNYWLIEERDTIYLVPIPNLRITEAIMGTVRELFDCENYIANYSSVNIIQPAIVKAQPGIDRRWKPYQKGVLEFT